MPPELVDLTVIELVKRFLNLAQYLPVWVVVSISGVNSAAFVASQHLDPLLVVSHVKRGQDVMESENMGQVVQT